MNAITPTMLRPRVEGHSGAAYFPGDGGWDEARQAWNLAVDQRPAAVLLPSDAADVAAGVRFAARRGLRIAVQGTGHGAAPLGDLHNTVLIRTTSLREVRIDAERRRARAGAGAIWDEVVGPATALGLTALHGSSPDVGVVGYTLGGGIGWLARRYGLAASSVTAIELVTADGEQVRTDADHEPELFWGMRGGGGNFGVATALEFALYPVEHAYAGWLIWPWQHAPAVIERWARWTEGAPDTITSAARILQLPPAPLIPEPLRGRKLVVIEAAYLGGEHRGEELLRPLRELTPEMDTFATIPAAGLARLHHDPEGPTPGIGDGSLFDSLTEGAVRSFLSVTGPGSGSALLSAEIRHLGGALAKPAPGGGALSHLDAGFVQYAVGIPADAGVAAAIARQARLVKDALAPWGSGRAYMNFAETPTDASTMFAPAAYQRLARLRGRIDPGQLFRASQEIPPLQV